MSKTQRVQDLTKKSGNYYRKKIANALSKQIIKKKLQNYFGSEKNSDDDNYDYYDDDDWKEPPDDPQKDYREGFRNVSLQYTNFLNHFIKDFEIDYKILLLIYQPYSLDISKIQLLDEWFAEFLNKHKNEILKKFKTLKLFSSKAVRMHYNDNRRNIENVASALYETLGEWLHERERKMLQQKIRNLKYSMSKFQKFQQNPRNTISSVQKALNDLISWVKVVNNWNILSVNDNRHDEEMRPIYDPTEGNYEMIVSNMDHMDFGGHFPELGDSAEILLKGELQSSPNYENDDDDD